MNLIEKIKTKVMKKEKTTKTVPTQGQIYKMILDYLKSSEKHYFQTRYVWDKKFGEDYFKVFPATLGGKLHYVKVAFEGGKTSVKVIDTSWVTTKNHLGMLKNNVFRQEMKHESVKPSLEMKVKFDIIKSFIELSDDAEALKVDIEKILK
jgi:hypothetical protein